MPKKGLNNSVDNYVVDVTINDFLALSQLVCDCKDIEFSAELEEDNLRKKVSELNTPKERVEYFAKLLSMDKNAKAWEYSDEYPFNDPKILVSSDEKEIKRFFAQNKDTLDIRGKAVLIKRLQILEKARLLKNARETGKTDEEGLKEILVPGEKFQIDNENNVSMTVELPKAQTSANGCWSCGLQMMLLSHGINVEQEEIRAFRSDFSEKEIQDPDFKNRITDNYYLDDQKGITEMADVALALAPDKMIRTFEIQLPVRAENYLENDERIDYNAYLDEAVKAASEKIRQILNEDKCTISFTNGNHYYAITSINGETIECLDSITGGKETLNLREVIDDLYMGKYTEGKPADFQLVWMANIELQEDGENFYNVPSHYLKLKNDDTFQKPPYFEDKEANMFRSGFEKNGFRVQMVGGKDDTEYDRKQGRNPLTQGRLLITETAYLPNKVDAKTIRKRAQERQENRTAELKEANIRLLGDNFDVPKRDPNLSENEMDNAVRDLEKSVQKRNMVVHFLKANGIYNLKEEEKTNFKGENYLWNNPGAILAFRIQKSYEAIKTLFSYMAAKSEDKAKWEKDLAEIEQMYQHFLSVVNNPDNAIPQNSDVPAIYPFKGYPKTYKDIEDALFLLSSMSDKIELSRFDATRYKVNPKDYNPSLLSRFAENIKEFSNPEAGGNLLKMCALNSKFMDSVNTLLTMPSSEPEMLNQRWDTREQVLNEYVKYSVYVCKDILGGNTDWVMKNHSAYINSWRSTQAENLIPNVRNFILTNLPEQNADNNEQDNQENKAENQILGNSFMLLNQDSENSFMLLNEKNTQVGDHKITIGIPAINSEKNLIDGNLNPENKNDVSKQNNHAENKNAENKFENWDLKINFGKMGNLDARSEKRKIQYDKFLREIGNANLTLKGREVFNKLGQLFTEMGDLLDSGKRAEVTYAELENLVKRYSEIQNEMESEELKDFVNHDSYRKFRLVMSKDLRTMYNVLQENRNLSEEEKQNRKFSLVDIFEESRAVTLNIDGKILDVKAGAQNTRIHIKTDDRDGFFTVHEEPFEAQKIYSRIMEDFCKPVGTGHELKVFADYLLNKKTKGNKKSNVRNMFETLDGRHGVNQLVRSCGSMDAFVRKFRTAIEEDAANYIKEKKIPNDSPLYRDIYKLVERYSNTVKGTHALAEAAFKVEGLYVGKGVRDNLGINPLAKLDKRNAAMSMMAGLLGIDSVVAKSENMRIIHNGKTYKGTFMEKAKGECIDDFDRRASIVDVLPEEYDKSPELMKSIANLQILDLICGNPDRHDGNYFLITKEVMGKDGKMTNVLVGVQGIDNDSCFGTKVDLDYSSYSAIPFKNMMILPEETARKIENLDLNLCRAMLIGYDLSTAEIDAALTRIKSVQARIKYGRVYFEEHPDAGLTDIAIKVVSDDELKDLSISEDLYVEREDSKHHNLFSRIHSLFKFKSKKPEYDPIECYLTSWLEEASSQNIREACIAEENINGLMWKMGGNAKSNLQNPNSDRDFENMLSSVRELQKGFNGVRSIDYSELDQLKKSSTNRRITNFYNRCLAVRDQVNRYLNRLEKNDAGKKNKKEINRGEAEKLRYLRLLKENLDRLCKSYKSLSEIPSELAGINAKKRERSERRKRLKEIAKKEKSLTAKNKSTQSAKKTRKDKPKQKVKEIQQNKPEQNAKEIQQNKPEQNAKEIQQNKPRQNAKEIQQNKPENIQKPASNLKKEIVKENPSKPVKANPVRNFISETKTMESCYQAIREKLTTMRDWLKTEGAKTAGIDYTLDGNEEYRKMAKSIDRCIMMTTPDEESNYPNYSFADLEKELRNLEDRAQDYTDTHYGLGGIRRKQYGKVRLACSMELSGMADDMRVVLASVRKKLNALPQEGIAYGNMDINRMKTCAGVLAERNHIAMESVNYRNYQETDRIRAARLSAFESLKKLNKEMYAMYSNNNCDEYLVTLNGGKKSPSIFRRAGIYVLFDKMDRIMQKDVTAFEAERIAKSFENYDAEVRYLSENPMFIAIQNICFQNKQDHGLSIWHRVEKRSDELEKQLKTELGDALGSLDARMVKIYTDSRSLLRKNDGTGKDGIQNKALAAGKKENRKTNVKKPVVSDKQPKGKVKLSPKDSKKIQMTNAALKRQETEAVNRAAAELYAKLILADPKNRDYLNMMAIDGTDLRRRDLVRVAKAYFTEKKIFEPARGEKMSVRIGKAVRKGLESEIMKRYRKTNLTVRLGQFVDKPEGKEIKHSNPKTMQKGSKPVPGSKMVKYNP